MEVEIIKNNNQVRLHIKGIVDEQGAEELKAKFQGIDLKTTTEVIIDCQGVEHIGSSGIGKILLMYKRLATVGNKLSVINLPEDLFELFRELKLETLFAISKR